MLACRKQPLQLCMPGRRGPCKRRASHGACSASGMQGHMSRRNSTDSTWRLPRRTAARSATRCTSGMFVQQHYRSQLHAWGFVSPHIARLGCHYCTFLNYSACVQWMQLSSLPVSKQMRARGQPQRHGSASTPRSMYGSSSSASACWQHALDGVLSRTVCRHAGLRRGLPGIQSLRSQVRRRG